VDANLDTSNTIKLIQEKLALTSTDTYADYLLYESLDGGKGRGWRFISLVSVLNQLNSLTRPFEISQRWGSKSGDMNRFVFKRPQDSISVTLTRPI
jgi:hypothetical protein